jgi:hypothetical protein
VLIVRRAVLIIVLAITVATLALAGLASVRSVDLRRAASLFADEHRNENFRSMHEIFPARPVVAGGDVWVFERDERELPAHYAYAGQDRSRAA